MWTTMRIDEVYHVGREKQYSRDILINESGGGTQETDSEMEGLGDFRGLDMVSCAILILGQQRGGRGVTMFIQKEHPAEESFTGEQGIFAALGVAYDLATHTIILCCQF